MPLGFGSKVLRRERIERQIEIGVARLQEDGRAAEDIREPLFAVGGLVEEVGLLLCGACGAELSTFATFIDNTKIATAKMISRNVTTMTIVDRASTNPGQWFSSA